MIECSHREVTMDGDIQIHLIIECIVIIIVTHKIVVEAIKQDLERRKIGHACTLCRCVKLLFEPLVHFCNGLNCPSKRIRRNSHYYHWCNSCYSKLDDNYATVKKSDMKEKNDEQPEKSWVQCDCCNRWMHQICGLFNARKNKELKSEHKCPFCTLDKRKKSST